MNRWHRRFCASPAWATFVSASLVPAVLSGLNLGDDVLEIGPGPGLTTEALVPYVQRLTVIEIDEVLSSTLSKRVADTGIAVVTGDATNMPFRDDRFSAAVCFTMLHHIPTPALQDRLLSEVHRVLRPGGLLAGSDSSGRGIQFRLTVRHHDPCRSRDAVRPPSRSRVPQLRARRSPRVDKYQPSSERRASAAP